MRLLQGLEATEAGWVVRHGHRQGSQLCFPTKANRGKAKGKAKCGAVPGACCSNIGSEARLEKDQRERLERVIEEEKALEAMLAAQAEKEHQVLDGKCTRTRIG